MIGKVRNCPPQLPPRNVKLAPAIYLPPAGRAHVTAVTTSREVHLGDPEKSRSSTFHTEVLRLPPEYDITGGVDPRRDSQRGFPKSILAESEVAISEACKFTPAEQHRLLVLRRQLVRCESELAQLRALTLQADGEGTGLAKLHEAHRVRINGMTFSQEDAKRDLCNVWLLERLRKYILFIDAGLENKLDGSQWEATEVEDVKPEEEEEEEDFGAQLNRIMSKKSAPSRQISSGFSEVSEVSEFRRVSSRFERMLSQGAEEEKSNQLVEKVEFPYIDAISANFHPQTSGRSECWRPPSEIAAPPKPRDVITVFKLKKRSVGKAALTPRQEVAYARDALSKTPNFKSSGI